MARLFQQRLLLAVLLLFLMLAGLSLVWYWPSLPPPAEVVRVVWTFEPPERGAIISTPLVADGRVYVTVIRDNAFRPQGAVYCLDAATHHVLWEFDDGGKMQHTYSSPCLAGGCIYVGEGMHANHVCRFYCLDAATGEKRWHFTTGGHIESSPCVADGRVFFGSGDDGLYCLDAATGARCWQFQGPWHIDANPVVLGQRLYAGSGVSRKNPKSEIFCITCTEGAVVWRTPTPLPAWGSPAVEGGQAFFGLGNGRVNASAAPPERPAGQLLCADAATGEVRWTYPVPDAVLARPTLDARHVFFGARDGRCYGLTRQEGALCWSRDLGSPIVTQPALADGRLYVVAAGGTVACLDAGDGRPLWNFDVAAHSQTTPRLFSSPVIVPQPGGGRRIYFGSELQNSVTSAAVLYCLEDGGRP